MKRLVKQHLKKALMVLPPVRRYLSEKYTLDASWKETAAERDRLALEVLQQRAAIEALAAERGGELQRQADQRQKLLFDHLHKCAGTSVYQLLKTVAGASRVSPHLQAISVANAVANFCHGESDIRSDSALSTTY